MSAKNIDDQDYDNQSTEITDSTYDDQPYEDDSTYSEDDSDEWSDDVDLSDEDAPAEEQPPAKKKTSNLTIGIILFVAIIGVFGFMALTGGDKGTAPQPSGETPQQVAIDADADDAETQDPVAQPTNIGELRDQNQADASSGARPPVAAAPSAPQQGLMDNPDLLNQNQNTTAEQPDVVAPALPEQAPPLLTGASEPELSVPAAPQPNDVVSAISPSVKPVSDFPTVDAIKKPDSVATDVASAPAAPVEADAVLPVPTAVNNSQAAELQDRVDAADAKIAALEKQLSDKDAALIAEKQKSANAIAAVTSAPSGPSEAEVDELKAKISDLETKLAAKVEKAAKPVVAPRPVVEEDVDTSYDAAPVKKPVVAAQPKVVVKHWTLKSAGAGKAILSDRDTGDLKTVRVGDTVPGLGRISSISSTSAGWTVKGTTGSVSE